MLQYGTGHQKGSSSCRYDVSSPKPQIVFVLTWNSGLETISVVEGRITKILNNVDQVIRREFGISVTRYYVMPFLGFDQWDSEYYLDAYCEE